jgi:hypothetical protein
MVNTVQSARAFGYFADVRKRLEPFAAHQDVIALSERMLTIRGRTRQS